jgi:hypothetical protein
MTLRGFALAAAAALTLAGCQSQYYLQNESHNLLTTDVIVRTEPSGAEIRWNDVSIGKSPLKMPVEYDHVEELWTRQTNVGARLREDWGTFGTIIGFPIWIPASFFHETEDVRRHKYGNNEFEITARMRGHNDEYRTIKIEGEEELEVRMVLDKR